MKKRGESKVNPSLLIGTRGRMQGTIGYGWGGLNVMTRISRWPMLSLEIFCLLRANPTSPSLPFFFSRIVIPVESLHLQETFFYCLTFFPAFTQFHLLSEVFSGSIIFNYTQFQTSTFIIFFFILIIIFLWHLSLIKCCSFLMSYEW